MHQNYWNWIEWNHKVSYTLIDVNLVIMWSCNLHAKPPIPKKPSKSGLIWMWHKDNLYLGTNTIRNGKPHLWPNPLPHWICIIFHLFCLSISIIMSSSTTQSFPFAELTPTFLYPKSLRFLGCQKPSHWPISPTAIVCFRFSPNFPYILGACFNLVATSLHPIKSVTHVPHHKIHPFFHGLHLKLKFSLGREWCVVLIWHDSIWKNRLVVKQILMLLMFRSNTLNILTPLVSLSCGFFFW